MTYYDSTRQSAAMRGLPLPVTDTNIVGSEKKSLQWCGKQYIAVASGIIATIESLM